MPQPQPQQRMKNPKDLYLWKNSSGAYYFRRRLPESLRAILGKTEIKVSLKTDSCKEARKLASIYSAEIQTLTMGDKKSPPSLQEILFSAFPEARKLKESVDNLPELLLPKNLRQTLGAEEPEPLAIPQPEPIQTFAPQHPTPQSEPSELLSEVIEAYFKEAELTRRWTSPRGADQAKEACRLFVEMIGKTLHSFRHTLLDGLKQSGAPLEIAQAIAGHEGQSLTYGHYGKNYKLSIMKESID